MAYNYSKLFGRLREKGMTQEKLSKLIDLHPSTLNEKLKNRSEFKQSEMVDIATILEIPTGELYSYFFVH